VKQGSHKEEAIELPPSSAGRVPFAHSITADPLGLLVQARITSLGQITWGIATCHRSRIRATSPYRHRR